MKKVEMEQALADLAQAPFDPAEFPFQFLECFGHKEKSTTLKKLRSGESNKSDVHGAILMRDNIHLKVAELGQVQQALDELIASEANKRGKPKYLLATDGTWVQAIDTRTDDPMSCEFADFADNFGFLLNLGGYSVVKAIAEKTMDVKATRQLNKLYVELLKTNPDWAHPTRKQDMNHFLARLIFCFFAEDTDILHGQDLFTKTIEQMTDGEHDMVAVVIENIFRAMNISPKDRVASDIPNYANGFPYVNGDLFGGSVECPKFSKIARSYLVKVGKLDWQQINPDIFGSMIQAVADDDERGMLGMHYTSVPNILKVLNPLFLDELRTRLDEAGDNGRKLLNLRKRMARIRVFDPACGSGNFLVIAYKEMRKVEAEINRRRGELSHKSVIPMTNFRGIEIRHFSCEIARLALIIAEFQCDVEYRGQQEALAEVLPLANENWITCGNALTLDWLDVFPTDGTEVRTTATDLLDYQPEPKGVDFENDGGETYICGNPPYLGSTWQSAEQKNELKAIFDGRVKNWKSLDYVAGWFMKAADYGKHTPTVSAFVTTNSICQGQQVAVLWGQILAEGSEIVFAHTNFKWANLASHNAGVTVSIVGIGRGYQGQKRIYAVGKDGRLETRVAANINPYLVEGANIWVEKTGKPVCEQSEMSFGNKPVDGGHLQLSSTELANLECSQDQKDRLTRKILGSAEFINGKHKHVLWIHDQDLAEALSIPEIAARIDATRQMRLASPDKGANAMAAKAHQMREMRIGKRSTIIVPSVSSENRPYLPVGLLDKLTATTNLAFGLYDAALWNLALIASKMHISWVSTVCSRMRTDYRYSNTLGWNTFPVPKLTTQNKLDLTRCAEDILLAREKHWPATIADLYDPKKMPENLRAAHDRNDEVLERIYIGRRFKNDTERLEKLFDMYSKMTAKAARPKGGRYER